MLLVLCLGVCARALPHSKLQQGNIRVTRYRRAGRDHPTSTYGGRFNEQMVNEGSLNCPSEIMYHFHLLSVAWRWFLYRRHM